LVTSIAPSAYSILFAFGRGWSDQNQAFCIDDGASEFAQTFLFDERRRGNAIEYVSETITLHKVLNGNATSNSIPSSRVFRRHRE
jgi:hypothetical protein